MLHHCINFFVCFPDLDETSKDEKPYLLSLRRAFIPSDDCLLISADYSQIELRILAHLSSDKRLIYLLQQKDGDVFKLIAASWLGIDFNKVSPDERQRAKQICYGILYGMGPKALSEQLEGQNILEEEALMFMTSFKTAYPDVQNFIENVKSSCREQVM